MVTAFALPPPSPVLHALVAKVSDPRHTTADVVDIIRVDAGLTAVLLQLGNSPFFARSGSRVATVDDAVLRVGETEVIRQIAARLTRWIMTSEGNGDGLARELLWRRSLMAAIAADELAERNGVNRAIAFTVGLLLDIGTLAIGSMVGARAMEGNVPESDEDGETRQRMAEGVLLGHSHAEIGAVLTEQWRLPSMISTAIRFHHSPQSAPVPSAIVDICHVADAIAGQCIGHPSMSDDTGPDEDIVKRLGLTGSALESLCADVAARYLRERDLWA